MRTEQDTMGTVMVPDEAYWGPQTQRAVDNFMISGMQIPFSLIKALARIKKAAACVNQELGLIDESLSRPIAQAAQEVFEGKLDNQFPIDIFQTGSGTSSNMNMNEVISSRANEIITGKKGGKSPVHPNDHVNRCQSSNDVIPTAIHIAAVCDIQTHLIPRLSALGQVLSQKADEFKSIHKIGRTHLQDAVPITLGQEFSGFFRQVDLGIERIKSFFPRLTELALGGTAVGTGINAHPEFAGKTIARIAEDCGIQFKEAQNHFEAQASQDKAVEASGVLKTIAISIGKIANDIRFLASGPRCGFGEIQIPSLQPGSSIMPGKVNPVIPEAVVQVVAQVVGNDAAITMGGAGGYFELNTMLPLIGSNLIQSIQLLSNVVHAFTEKCIKGIQADAQVCASMIEKSLAMATPLVPIVGYDKSAEIAKKAYETGKTVREVALDMHILPKEKLTEILKKAIGS